MAALKRQNVMVKRADQLPFFWMLLPRFITDPLETKRIEE